MIDKEKVIKGINCCLAGGFVMCEECPYMDKASKSCKGTDGVLKDALELLKEQEPIAPKQQEETHVWTVCGNCSQHLISKWIYCPYCGRKVKWDGLE